MANNQDRLPPHSEEAEAGVLGCVLLSPECLAQCVDRLKSVEMFYDLRHQTIYRTLLDMRKRKQAIDLITLHQRFKDKKLLEQAGGMGYLSLLPDKVPSAANLGHYLEIVEEKHELRRIVKTCAEVTNKIYDHPVDLAELKFAVQSELAEVFGDRQEGAGETSSWRELQDFDTDNDPSCLIGMRDGKTTRFVCRASGNWIIAPSGVGKSSAALTLAAHCAIGEPLWSITPVRPLRVLFIQAENDKGDMSEMVKGISDGMNIGEFGDEKRTSLVQQNIRFRSISGKIGERFCQWLRNEIIEFRAELAFVDPLLSFAGIDVARIDQASQLCRLWLNPILIETGAAMIGIHHTGKPQTKDRQRGESTVYDMMYSGIGSSELVNWARSVMILQPASAGVFRLILAKRGIRAWATHPSGEYTTTLWLRHAAKGIFWEQIDPPEEPDPKERKGGGKAGKPSEVQKIASMNLATFCLACNPDGEGLREISKRLEIWLAKQGVASASERTYQRAIPLLVANGKLVKGEDLKFRKGPNA